MKIDSLDAYLVRLPLKKPFRLADRPIDHIESVFLRMRSGGLSGWSEVFPGNEPVLTAAWSRGVFSVLVECLFPLIVNNPDIDTAERLNELLDPIKGNRHAKSALDMAWWDLRARMLGKPLHKVIGGVRESVEVGLVFDRYESQSAFLDDLARAVEEGYRRITLKIRPGWDIAMLSAVRTEYPIQMIQCDVEGALSMERHSDTIFRFDDFMPALLEQPLSASEYVGHAMLQDSLRTPICLDESITTLEQARIALDLRSAGTFCLKGGKMGGLTTAREIHDAALAAEVDCYSGCDILTSVGYRFVLALGALKGCEQPTDAIRFEEYLEVDPGPSLPSHEGERTSVSKPGTIPEPPKPGAIPVVDFHDGDVVRRHTGPNPLTAHRTRLVSLWTEPGIGFDPDLRLIESLAIERKSEQVSK